MNSVFVAAAAVAGVYTAGSILSTIGTTRPTGRLNSLEAHEFVTDAVPSRGLKFAILTSETATTVALWIGLVLVNNEVVSGLALAGYISLLAWLIPFSLATAEIAPKIRKAGLAGAWIGFAGSFVAAAAVASTIRTASEAAQACLWLHAAHRLLADGWYTARMLLL